MKTEPIQPKLEKHECHRMHACSPKTSAVEGKVVWSPVKSLWFTCHALVAVIGGALTLGFDVMAVCAILTVVTLSCGHTVGLHRLLIHRSFECPRWVEYSLVHLGTLVGMGGPLAILYMHDIRDWAQRHRQCHPMFSQQGPWWRDWLWQMHGVVELKHPPRFVIEDRVLHDLVYRLMQFTWMLHQIPLAVVLYWLGGLPWVVWGISVRIVVSLTGHWLIGYLAHNVGNREWNLKGHAVQGFNLPYCGLITMGEAWHNNHHAFPGSARLGLHGWQADPGWWVVSGMWACGLAWDVKLPEDMAPRPELERYRVLPDAGQRRLAPVTLP